MQPIDAYAMAYLRNCDIYLSAAAACAEQASVALATGGGRTRTDQLADHIAEAIEHCERIASVVEADTSATV